MPRLTIYVPDGLYKELMEKPGINVSATCQAALTNLLASMKRVAPLETLLTEAGSEDVNAWARRVAAHLDASSIETPDGED
jgi:post-segregation antitoxin (ccd killing protein)